MPASTMRLKSMIVETARLSGLSRLLTSSFRRIFGGVGAIIAMHRVREPSDEPFQPNRTLEVTPAFLDHTLRHLRDMNVDIVSLDEVHRRLTTGDAGRRFVCFTLDDGYLDNFSDAFPVFQAHGAPFSIYLTTGFVDRLCVFWWMALEDVIRRNDAVTIRVAGETHDLATGTLDEKEKAFEIWHGRFRALAEGDVEAAARHLCDDYQIDQASFCAGHAMTWDMAREITEGGLGTIELHTERHLALSRQRPDGIRAEMERCRARIAEKTGRVPRHFAYPFGDADAVSARDVDLISKLPITTATTTRSNILRPGHADALTALPRITLNGHYQSEGYVDLALSGLPSVLSRS